VRDKIHISAAVNADGERWNRNRGFLRVREEKPKALADKIAVKAGRIQKALDRHPKSMLEVDKYNRVKSENRLADPICENFEGHCL